MQNSRERTNLPRRTGDVWSALACGQERALAEEPGGVRGIDRDRLEAVAARRREAVEVGEVASAYVGRR